MLLRVAPPQEATPATHLTIVIAHLVFGELSLFAGWDGQFWRDDDYRLEATEADGFLVDVAKDFGVPLITNEGVSPSGFVEKSRNLRGKCRAAGVRALSPKEYLDELGVDVAAEALVVYEAFCDLGRRFLDGEVACDLKGAGVRQALDLLLGHYNFVLLDAVDPEVGPPPSIGWHP